MKVLIINMCTIELHENEFIKPIFDIISHITKDIDIIKYTKINNNTNIKKYDKIIVSGTALKNYDYLNYIENFTWIKKNYNSTNTNNKPHILGICAGTQIITQIFNAELRKGIEIGVQKLKIIKNDKLLKNLKNKEIYCLHNKYFTIPENFTIIAQTNYPQIIKNKNSNIYGILFHPEVNNKEIITNFLEL